MIKIRRVYDPEEADENYKVLIDRLLPRGISKEKAGWNEWIKDIVILSAHLILPGGMYITK
jgi:uncharacterized protein YeaO (DUF488 family)